MPPLIPSSRSLLPRIHHELVHVGDLGLDFIQILPPGGEFSVFRILYGVEFGQDLLGFTKVLLDEFHRVQHLLVLIYFDKNCCLIHGNHLLKSVLSAKTSFFWISLRWFLYLA